MKRLLIALVCAALSMGAAYDDLLQQLGWDDQYREALQSIERTYGKEKTQWKLQSIRLAGVVSEENPARTTVKQAFGIVGGSVRSAIRLEYGNASMGSTGVVWFLETSSGPVLLRSDAKSFCKRNLTSRDYSELVDLLEREKVWEIKSDADDQMDDGSVYFLSVNLNGKSHQAVIYGPPSYGQSAAQRGLTASADGFARIINELLTRWSEGKR